LLKTAKTNGHTNQTVKGERLSENQNKDHPNKQLWLLSVCPAHSNGFECCHVNARKLSPSLPDTSITNDPDGHASGEASKATSQARGEMGEAVIQLVPLGIDWMDNPCQT
jgi:hypothetical protein